MSVDMFSLMSNVINHECALRWTVVAHNSDDYFEKLSSAKTARQKFAVTMAHMKIKGLLPKEIIPNRRNADLATILRNIGNEHFMAKRYLMAVENYTKSLMNSNLDSVCYAYALANRSAALFHMGLYEDCLKDIGRAVESGVYPVDLRYKLSERVGNAHRMLGNGELAIKHFSECLLIHLDKSTMSKEKKCNFKTQILDAMKESEGIVRPTPSDNMLVDELTGGKNENIPSFSKYLEIKSSEDMGRGVYATHDINPGTYNIYTFICTLIDCL